MDLNKENSFPGSEKAAVKTLLELSQKEMNYELGSEKDIDAWVVNKPQNMIKKSIFKNNGQRPATSMSKPPRSLKIQTKVQKNESFDYKLTNLLLPIVSLNPPSSNVRINFIRPPISAKIRSSSSKDKETRRKSVESVSLSRDVNFSFRKKMMKYKIFKDLFNNSKPEGLKLITMPRPYQN